jgi:Arm DNA-binding domain
MLPQMRCEDMLTDVQVKKIAPMAKRQEIRDEGARGLYLIVQPSGKKSWAARYSREGRVLKTTIGPYPAVTLADARRRALQIAADVARGEDPQQAKKVARIPVEARTLRIIAEES